MAHRVIGMKRRRLPLGISLVRPGSARAATAVVAVVLGVTVSHTASAQFVSSTTAAPPVVPIATGTNSAAGGYGASATGAGSTVVGDGATDNGNAGAAVFGSNAAAAAANVTALGAGSSASTAGGVALGQGSTATRAGLAGTAEKFSGTAVASTNGAVSVGSAGNERQIINVAGGTLATDAVNLRQLQAVGNDLAGSLGGGAAFNPATGAYTAPTFTVAGANYGNVGSAIGALNNGLTAGQLGAFVANNGTNAAAPAASGMDSAAGGFGSVASGTQAVAVGSKNTVSGQQSTGLGNDVNVAGNASIGIGGNDSNTAITVTTASGTLATYRAITGVTPTVGDFTRTNASGNASMAIGEQSSATADFSSVIGWHSRASGIGSLAVGDSTNVTGVGASAFGAGSTASASNSVALGSASVANRAGLAGTAEKFSGTAVASTQGAVSVGSAGNERQIIDVAGGTQATDAVNVRQLQSVGGNLAVSLGGGATFDPTTGAYTAPTFTTAAGTTATTVQGALANETAGITTLGNATAGKLGGGTTYSPATGALAGGFTVNGTTYGDVATAISGTAATGGIVQRTATAGQVAVTAPTGTGAAPGAAQVVTNVAAGTVAAGSTQAIDGGQLSGTATSVARNFGGGSVVNPDGTVSAPAYTVGGQTYNAVGTALAATNALGVQYTPDAAGAPTNAVDLTKGGTLAPVAVTGLASATAPTGAVALQQMPAQYSTAGTPTTANPAVPSNDVTLAGANAGAPVGLHNVAAGTLNANSTDAVNGSQLYATNQTVTGLAGGTTGIVQRTATAGQVAVTAPTGTGAAPGAAQVVTNVAAGTVAAGSTQAINGSQLAITNANAAGLGNTAAAALGGGSAYNPATGALTAPAYNVFGTTQTGLANTVAALQTGAPVQFSNAAGAATPQVPSNDVTLVGANAGAPVTLHNVAAGTAATDVVDVGQLNATVAAGGAAVVPVRTGDAGPFTTTATGAGSLAVGSNAVAGAGSTAIGTGATDNGNANATVLGNGASVAAGLGGSNVALGQGSTVAAAAVATPDATIGGTTYTFAGGAPVGAVSVGTANAPRQIQNVAAGQLNAASTDAVNGSQLFATNQQVGANTAAIGNVTAGTVGPVQRTSNANELALVAPGGSGAAPGGAQALTNVAAGAVTATSTQAVNGSQLYAADQQIGAATAGVSGLAGVLGGTTYDAATGTVTGPTFNVGGGTQTTFSDAISALASGAASGNSRYLSGNSNGPSPVANGVDSIAIGTSATTAATATRALALGTDASATGPDSVALGAGSVAGPAATAGRGVAAALTNANGATTAIGYDTTDRTLLGPVSVGSGSTYRQIQNVADGQAPTDVVNVRQLQGGVQTAINYTDTYAVGYSQTGVTLNSPYAGGPVVIHNVGAGAVTATSTQAVNGSQLYAVQQVANNSVQYDPASSGMKSNTITLAGGDPTSGVQLKNVAAGSAPTDAANVGQLNNLATYTQNGLNSLNSRIDKVNSAAQGGIAIALAATALRYDDRPGKTSLSMGAAGYSGNAGLAFGIGSTSFDGGMRYNLAVSFSPNNSRADVGVAGGVSWTLN